MATTATKTNLPAKHILASAHKVKDQWETNGSLFANYKVGKTDFDTLLAEASAAEVAYNEAQLTRKTTKDRLQTEYETAVTEAKQKREAAEVELDQTVAVAAEVRRAKLTALSRASQGARFFAKSTALSDELEENDAAAKEL